MLKKAFLVGLLLAAVAPPTISYAHHSFAAFFTSDRTVKVTGRVTSFRFQNPHGTIALEVRGPDGSVQEWRAETNAPAVLQRRGWNRNTIRAGDVITIEVGPHAMGSLTYACGRLSMRQVIELEKLHSTCRTDPPPRGGPERTEAREN